MRRRGATLLLLATLGCATGMTPLAALWPRAEPAPTLIESPAAEVAAPKGLVASEGELRAVPLRWDPVLAGDVGGYVVERAGPGDEAFERVAVLQGRTATSWVDRGGSTSEGSGMLGDGAIYRYRVRSFDAGGRLGAAASPAVEAKTAPPPPPPAGLRAYSHLPRQVFLTWLPAQEATGYVIYRSPSVAGEYEPIVRVRARFRTHYVDDALGDLRVFHYKITSVNAAGGEGPESEPVRAVTKAGPLPPLDVRAAEQRLGANRLAWEPNVERDLAGYRLRRRREGGSSPEPVASLGAETTTAWDEAVGAGEAVTYDVIAFDRDGLESAASDAVRVESLGYQLEAEAVAEGVRLSWRARPEEGFTSARVLRRGRLRAREIARVTGNEYVDRDVVPGQRYRYQVVLERADGTSAPASRWIELSLPTEAGPR